MLRFTKYLVAAAVVAAWLAFALSPKSRMDGTAGAAGPAEMDHSGLPVRELEGRVLHDGDRLGQPGAIERVGDHLVVADGLGTGALHVLRRDTGEPVTSFGAEGEGPGEFRAPRSIDPVPGRPAFWAFDIGLQRLTLVELREGLPAVPPADSRMLRLQSDAPVTDPVWVEEGRLLALGFFREGRLGEFDGEGVRLRTVGPLPPWDEEVPANVLQHAYQGRMKPRPDRDLLVIACRHAALLEVYRPDGRPVRRFTGPFDFPPRFSVMETPRGATMASGEDLRFGYIDVAPGMERIYALFSGRTRAGYPGRANYGEYVHVFDWEGNFQEALRLDSDAIALAVDEAGGLLYAVRHDPVPAVLAYRLP